MKNERGALHLEVLCALPGRLRVRLERPVDCTPAVLVLPGVRECRFNGRVSTLLCLFDEHAVDVETLIGVLQKLIEHGATVVVIEHDLDMIANADYVIDMGPGGGETGGRIVAEGTPAQVAANSDSLTGRYLARELE